MVQASVKRAVLVGEFFEIRVEVQRRQLPPSMTRQELHFSLVEAKRLQHVWALQVVLGIHFSLQHAKHAVPPGIGECRQVELSNVLPVTVVARLSEVLSTSIYIKPVCEPLADSAHMTSGSPRCLQDGHVVASLHQFVGARKPGNAGPSDYDFPGSPRLATGRDDVKPVTKSAPAIFSASRRGTPLAVCRAFACS